MSNDKLHWYHVTKIASPYNGTRRLLHQHMAMMADRETGIASATQLSFGERVGCSERRVRELISEMSTGRARVGGAVKMVPITIVVERRGREGSAGKYRLLPPEEWVVPSTGGTASLDDSRVPAEPRTSTGGTASSTGGTAYVNDAVPPPIPFTSLGGSLVTPSFLGASRCDAPDWDDSNEGQERADTEAVRLALQSGEWVHADIGPYGVGTVYPTDDSEIGFLNRVTVWQACPRDYPDCRPCARLGDEFNFDYDEIFAWWVGGDLIAFDANVEAALVDERADFERSRIVA